MVMNWVLFICLQPGKRKILTTNHLCRSLYTLAFGYMLRGFGLKILSHTRDSITNTNTLKNPHENPHENRHEPKFEKETCTKFLSHEFVSIIF